MKLFKDFTSLDMSDLNFSALLIKSIDGRYHFYSDKMTSLKETLTYINMFFLNP